MINRFLILITLFCTVTLGYINAGDREPSCIDWGNSSNAKLPHLLTHTAGNLAYIIFTPHKEHWPALITAAHHIQSQIKPNISHIKTTADLINVWQPIEQGLHNNTSTIHLAVASFSGSKLLAIVRGDCGLYHFKKDKCTAPAQAETLKSEYHRNSQPKNEFVSLCGIQEWNRGDKILMYTPTMERRLCAETICTEFTKQYDHFSASRLSYLLLLHAFAPQMPLKTQDECDAAATQAEKDSACIVIKKIV